MANPSRKIVDEDSARRVAEASSSHYETNPVNPELWSVRDSVRNAVRYILNDTPANTDDIVGQYLESARPEREKPGFFKRVFGTVKGWFASPKPKVEIGKFELPTRNDQDFCAVADTLNDLVPARHLIQTTPYNGTCRGDMEALLGNDAFAKPEIVFVYRDLGDPQTEQDYQYAIELLRKNAAPAAVKATIFELRLIANAHKIARERYARLGKVPSVPATDVDIPISPDDFREAYAKTYLDHFDFENEDVRKAALQHAMRQLTEEADSGEEVTLKEILTKIGKKDWNKIITTRSTSDEISKAISDGDIELNDIPDVISRLRAALLSGRYNKQNISREENLGPLILKLNRLYRLYRGLASLEGVDEVALETVEGALMTMVADEATEARRVLTEARVGPVPSATGAAAATTTPALSATPEGTTPVAAATKTLKEKLTERLHEMHENPLTRELIQFVFGIVLDYVLSRVARKKHIFHH